MRSACLSLFLSACTLALLSADGLPQPSPQVSCAASPRQALLPEVIAPAAGESPIWFVDGGGGQWQGPNVPVKSVWILERKIAGALRVTGRQRESTQSLTFREAMNGPVIGSLVIDTPAEASMTPGGASAEVMRKFAFVASYVFYPSPGCWELDAQLGEQRRKVVVAVS